MNKSIGLPPSSNRRRWFGATTWLTFGKAGIVVAVAAAIAGAVAIWTAKTPSEAATITVRLKWHHQAQSAGFYVAKEQGYYAREGLHVQLQAGGLEAPAIQLVASGSEEFGVAGADQILLARAKGVPVVGLAVIYRESPMILFAKADAGIRSPADFVGRRVGVKYGGNEEFTYRALLDATGVDVARIQEVPVRYDMGPFFRGEIDVWPGYVINEPILAEEHGLKVALIRPRDYGLALYGDTIFTTETILRQRPQLIEAFLRATLRGWQHAMTDVDSAVRATLAVGANLDDRHERRMMEASVPLIRPDNHPVGWMDADGWQKLHALLLKHGLLAKPLHVESAFSTAALERALSSLASK